MSDPEDTVHELADDGLLEESIEELYEDAPTAYFSSLLDGRIVKANRTFMRWLQYDEDALLGGKRLHDLLAPGARIYYETHYAPLLQMQGQVREIAVELIRSDGSRLPVLMNSTLVRDAEGKPRIVRTTAFDASERRRYERELLRARAEAESRARAAVAVAHVAEGVVLVGEGGDVELVNPAAESILGVCAAKVVGRRATEAIDGWELVATRVLPAAPDERPSGEVVPIARDGRERWLAVNAVDAGDAVAYTLRDVTAERDLDQIRADVVAIVSHELRTPLTGAYGAAHTLLGRESSLGPAERHRFVEMIVEQLGRLAKILDQILVTSRLDSGNIAGRIEVFDAADVVATILESFGDADRGRVIVDAAEGADVRADLDHLRQVMVNLVDNALKYSSGPVKLSAEPREVAVRFTVSDDGPGIPDSERERVFEKFFRLDPSQRSGVGGTGLGLYISRELVHRMGGRIGFLPRPRGTSVFVDVPLAGG